MGENKSNYKQDLKLLVNSIVYLCISFLFFLIIEWMQRGKEDTLIFIGKYNDRVLVNYIIMLIFIAPAILFKRTHFVALILGIPWVALGNVSSFLLESRGVPLMWSDIYTLDEGRTLINQYLTREVILQISETTIICILVVGGSFLIKFNSYQVSFIKRLGVFGCILAACFIGWHYSVQSIGIQRGAWDIATIYRRDGFIYSLSESYLAVFRKPLEGYSKETILNIVSQVNQKDLELSDEKPNIIMVQTESLFDPTTIEAAEFNEDPITSFRENFNKGYHGYLQVPTIGGGTVRTEFEVLSGMNLDYLAPGEIPYNSGVLSKAPIETIAYILKEKGYQNTAIHNYKGNFYSRNKTFKNLGFDRFIPMEAMTGLIKYHDFPEDMVLLDYIKRTLEESSEKNFIFAITACSHGPYTTATKQGNERYVSGNLPENALHQLQNYTSLIRRTDKFIGALTEYVYSLKQHTILVVYSDHYPRLEVIDTIESEEKFNTPYFIIDNQKILKSNGNHNIEAYQLAANVLDLSGLQGGIINSFHSIYAQSKDYQKNLNLLQYDILFGKKYAMNNQMPYSPTEVKIGLETLEIKEIKCQNDKLNVIGTGFTESSKIFSDNQLIETEFIDEYTLLAKEIKHKPNVVQVKLLGRYSAPLLVSNAYIVNKSH